MSDLAEQKCEACRAGTPPVSPEELETLQDQVRDWSVADRDGVKRLERTFEFPDFAEALAFTNKVGALAEAEDHHPKLTTEWGKVVVTWWTHSVNGLHRNDFIMAARTDRL